MEKEYQTITLNTKVDSKVWRKEVGDVIHRCDDNIVRIAKYQNKEVSNLALIIIGIKTKARKEEKSYVLDYILDSKNPKYEKYGKLYSHVEYIEDVLKLGLINFNKFTFNLINNTDPTFRSHYLESKSNIPIADPSEIHFLKYPSAIELLDEKYIRDFYTELLEEMTINLKSVEKMTEEYVLEKCYIVDHFSDDIKDPYNKFYIPYPNDYLENIDSSFNYDFKDNSIKMDYLLINVDEEMNDMLAKKLARDICLIIKTNLYERNMNFYYIAYSKIDYLFTTELDVIDHKNREYIIRSGNLTISTKKIEVNINNKKEERVLASIYYTQEPEIG